MGTEVMRNYKDDVMKSTYEDTDTNPRYVECQVMFLDCEICQLS